MVSDEFENAYAAHKRTLGEPNIGAYDAHRRYTREGISEDYATEALRRNIMPDNIISLHGEGVTIDEVDSFLEGQGVLGISTTADAAYHIIITLHKTFQDEKVPIDYSQPLLRMGGGPFLICDCWHNNIALEYAQQMVADRIAERKAR
jgi:hypothetical protein